MRTDQKIFCLKTVLSIFLCILWLVSAVIFGILLWFILDYWTNEYLELGVGLYRYQHLIYLTLAACAPVVVFSLLGLIGGCCKKKWLMVMYLIAVVAAIICTIAAGVYGVVCRHEIEETVRNSNALNSIINNKYAYDSTNRITKAVDIMQKELNCCGAENPKNWISSNWLQQVKAASTGIKADENLAPASCCQEFEIYEQSSNLCPIFQLQQKDDLNTKIWHAGCREKLEEYFDKYIVVVIAMAAVFLLLELICMIVTSMYVHLLNSLYEAPHDDIVYDMAHNQEKSPYPSRGDYREYYH